MEGGSERERERDSHLQCALACGGERLLFLWLCGRRWPLSSSHLATLPFGGGARGGPLGITEGCLCGLEGWTSPGGGLKPHACFHVAPVALQHSRRFPHAPLLRAGLRVGAPERAALGVQCDLRQPRVGALSICGGSDLFHSSFRFGCGLLAPLLGHELHTAARLLRLAFGFRVDVGNRLQILWRQ